MAKADKIKPDTAIAAERYAALFAMAPAAMLLLGPGDQILDMNRSACAMFGRSIEDGLGQDICTLIPLFKGKEAELENGDGVELLGVKPDGFSFPLLVQVQESEGHPGNLRIVLVQDHTAWTKRERELEDLQNSLEFKVKVRTVELASNVRELRAARAKLGETLGELQLAQDELVRSEKMSALGGLVAGVAHEINTPVGIGVTAVTHMANEIRTISDKYQNKTMQRADLEVFLTGAEEANRIIYANLCRAAELVRSFKQVAVDQTSGERRVFLLNEYLEEVIVSLRPNLKKSGADVTLECADDLRIDSYPGALAQILTNLIFNSLLHAFEPGAPGNIRIGAELDGGQVSLVCRDDGKGMTAEIRDRIFDPFYTTKRGEGGSGLGMHIVFNLVTRTLAGSVQCVSSPGEGTSIIMKFPQHTD